MFYRLLFLFTLFINVNVFCFAEEIKQDIPAEVSEPQIKGKPFSAAIFIDDDEIDVQKKSAITKDLSALFYLQACPLVIVGEHLLINLIKNLDFLKAESYTQLKYFIKIKGLLKEFDKNWITLQNNSYYVLIPRKHIEYFFNIELEKNTQIPLIQELENLCNQEKIIDQNGVVCKTIEDILCACGFDVNQESNYAFVNYKNLLNLEIKTDDNSRNDFYLNATNYLSNLLRKANDTSKWHMLINGHGQTSSAEQQNSLCCLTKKHFKVLFQNICTKNVAWIGLNSCHLGGPNREIIESLAKELFNENMCPCIVLQSAADSPSFSFSPNEPHSQETLKQAKNLDLILFEPQNSATTFGLYFSALIHPSFFKGQNIKNSFFSGALHYLDGSEENVLVLSNWPLILDPNKNLKFVPMENEKLISLISEQNAQEILETKNQQIIFLDTPIIKEIKFSEKIPFLLSTPASSSINVIEKIDASAFKKGIKEFFNKIFINQHVQIACSKEFLIKELILGPDNNKYSNIYANQFYDKEKKAFIIDIIWQDSDQAWQSQYILEDEKEDIDENLKEIKPDKKDEWTEDISKTLYGEELSDFVIKFRTIEQQVKGELTC